MHLVASWQAATLMPPFVLVLAVDHGLRPEARLECEAVVQDAALLGLEAHILSRTKTLPQTGIQAAARARRYELLIEHMADHARRRGEKAGKMALVTAHHRDDLAETVLMRLARGAGVDGLSAMEPVSRLPIEPHREEKCDVALVRPFLDVPKARLVATLRARGVAWHEDPSNENELFERPRLRAATSARQKLGLSDAALARTARRMARARDALEQNVAEALAPHMRDPLLHHGGLFTWRWSRDSLPDEIAVRLLARVLPAIGGCDEPARLMRVEQLWDEMRRDDFKGATLSGCIVKRVDPERIVIYREPARGARPLGTMKADRATAWPMIWDNRFEIAGDIGPKDRLTVRAFQRADLEMFEVGAFRAPLPYPIEALQSTPTIINSEGAIWIPALDVHQEHQEAAGRVGYMPKLTCRFLTTRLKPMGWSQPGPEPDRVIKVLK